jgi:protein-disulfide isomerase/uncharacterized membrane protein
MQQRRSIGSAALAAAIFAAVGLAVSASTYSLHRSLASEPGFASFCNVNEVVNCDVVLTSSYARLLGMPVALWSAGFYLLLGVLVATTWRGVSGGATAAAARRGRRAADWTVALAGFGLVFSAYLAVIALFVIEAVCLMCGALYLISLGSFVAAWWLRRASSVESKASAAAHRRQDRWVTVGAVAVAVAVVLAAGWEGLRPGPSSLAAGEIARRRPDFYRWFVSQPVRDVPLDDGKQLGPSAARVTIVAYSDFECGHCARLAKTLHEMLPRYGGDVRLVFHHFPLDRSCNPSLTGEVHRRACRAAVAAECAADQGRFWPYHDLLFANQQRLEDSHLLSYAEQVGLARAQFQECLGGPRAADQVARDVEAGRALGVESTPTLFINGRVIKGALDAELMAYAVGLTRSGVDSSGAAGTSASRP